jgi:hypothetical protein
VTRAPRLHATTAEAHLVKPMNVTTLRWFTASRGPMARALLCNRTKSSPRAAVNRRALLASFPSSE